MTFQRKTTGFSLVAKCYFPHSLENTTCLLYTSRVASLKVKAVAEVVLASVSTMLPLAPDPGATLSTPSVTVMAPVPKGVPLVVRVLARVPPLATVVAPV